jgi:hypothetical protein
MAKNAEAGLMTAAELAAEVAEQSGAAAASGGAATATDDDKSAAEYDEFVKLREAHGLSGEVTDSRPGEHARPNKKEEAKAPDDAKDDDEDEGDETDAGDDSDGGTTDSADADAGDSNDRGTTDPKIERAVRALKRDGVSDARIDHLRESDPDLLAELGLAAFGRQQDHDRQGNELGELRKRVGDSKAGQAGDESGQDGGGDAPKGAASTTADLEDFLTPLDDFEKEYGEDAAKPIREAFAGYDRKVTAQVEAMIEERMDAVFEHLERQEVAEVRQQLSERFPQLKKPEEFERVTNRMRRLSRPDEHGNSDYESIEDLMTDAVTLEFGAEQLAELESRKKGRTQTRRRAQTTTSSAVPAGNVDGLAAAPESEAEEFAKFRQLRQQHGYKGG